MQGPRERREGAVIAMPPASSGQALTHLPYGKWAELSPVASLLVPSCSLPLSINLSISLSLFIFCQVVKYACIKYKYDMHVQYNIIKDLRSAKSWAFRK